MARAVADATVEKTKSAVSGTGRVARRTGGAAVDLGTEFVDVSAGALSDFGRGVTKGVRGAGGAVSDATLSLLEAMGFVERRTSGEGQDSAADVQEADGPGREDVPGPESRD